MEVGDVDLNDWDMAFGTRTTPEAALPDLYEFNPAELDRLRFHRAAYRAGLYSDDLPFGRNVVEGAAGG